MFIVLIVPPTVFRLPGDFVLLKSERLLNLVLLMFYSLIIDITVALGTCSPSCVSCINDTCVTCTQGSYLKSGSCHSCPENCTSCNNYGVCNNCTEGYFGLSCNRTCISSMCINNTCDKDSGLCLHGCIDGYFVLGSSCYQCGAFCKTCANFSNNCLECKEGYYGSSCQYPCSYCKDGICTRDSCTYDCADGFYRGNEACNLCYLKCTSCLLFDTCTACVEGYFGPACQYACTDCSPCTQDGSCPTKTQRSSVPATTSLLPSMAQSARPNATSLLPSMSQSARPNYVESTTHQSYPATTRDSNNEGGYQQKKPMDNTIKYAVGGSVGGTFVIVMIAVAVFVAKRRSEVKRTCAHINNQARESDGTSHDYTTLAMGTRQGDGHIYSGLEIAPNVVTMETMSPTRDHSGQETHILPQKYVCDTEPGYYSYVN